MILSFKKQFENPILYGTKIHTIREDKTRRWRKDKSIHFSTDVRTKNYNCFYKAKCTGVERIFMTYAFNNIIEVTINDRYLTWNEIEKLAKNDGFESYEDFFNWFYPVIKKNKDECFSGRIIHWTDFRYNVKPF